MILHIERAKQGIGEDRHLSPSIDQLGPNIHQVEPIGISGLDDDGLSLVQVHFQQVHAVDAQSSQVRPGFPELLQSFIAGFNEDIDEHRDNIPQL